MRIAYTTTFDALNIHNWSGTPYFMSQALQASGMELSYIGNLSRRLPPFFKWKQILKKYLSGQHESPSYNAVAARNYSEQAAKALKNSDAEIVLSPLINPIAYLECKQPIVLWTDALYAGLVGFYPRFSSHSASSIRQGNAITAACLSRCQLAIFSSDWAAQTAMSLYGTDARKIKVVPFGANIESRPSFETVKNSIKNRSRDKIKLLFLAKSWERKGGDIVLAVAQALHQAGQAVELTLVGHHPPNVKSLPVYIKSLGFISKHTREGKAAIQQLLIDTHFLFVPSRAEAYGIVFCEANAFGVPCLTTYIGGIPTIIKNDINGVSFSLDASIADYCNYLINIMQNYATYQALALSAFNEYETRLNWKVSVEKVKNFINEAR